MAPRPFAALQDRPFERAVSATKRVLAEGVDCATTDCSGRKLRTRSFDAKQLCCLSTTPSYLDNAPRHVGGQQGVQGNVLSSLGCVPARRSKFRNIELISLAPNCPLEPSEKSTISVGGMYAVHQTVGKHGARGGFGDVPVLPHRSRWRRYDQDRHGGVRHRPRRGQRQICGDRRQDRARPSSTNPAARSANRLNFSLRTIRPPIRARFSPSQSSPRSRTSSPS